jgi:NAD(P)H-flavin reductase
MHLNHKYQTRLLGSAVVTGSTGSKMVILKLNRPVLFRFKPGQYAFLRVNEIDNSWHPFAIASYPDSSQLEFYIEVYEGKAWTKKLWDLLEANNEKGAASSLQLTVEVMGPYGTSLAKTEDYSHILAVGAGTGMSIVTNGKQQRFEGRSNNLNVSLYVNRNSPHTEFVQTACQKSFEA